MRFFGDSSLRFLKLFILLILYLFVRARFKNRDEIFGILMAACVRTRRSIPGRCRKIISSGKGSQGNFITYFPIQSKPVPLSL